MRDDFAEDVYLTLCGELVEAAQIKGIENVFQEGSPCSQWYSTILDARNRLLDRLGVPEDDDLEIMLTYHLLIQENLCLKMFHYGATLCAQSETPQP